MLPDVIPHGSRCCTALPSPAGKPGGTSVSVMNALTAFLTEKQSSHFWGRSSAELSAFGRKEGGEPTELAFLVWRGRGGRSRAPADPAVPVLPCSPGISFHRVLGPNFPSYGLCQMCFT